MHGNRAYLADFGKSSSGQVSLHISKSGASSGYVLYTIPSAEETHMNVVLLTAAISGAVSIAGVIVSYLLSKRKEREADWRKLKLERYDEYVTALSGVVKGGELSLEAQARYATAVNGIALVAPPTILRVLYAFQDEKSGGNKRSKLLDNLMNALRHDIHPGRGHRKDAIAVRFMGISARSNCTQDITVDESI
jgi:hypothetical protein